MSRPSPFVGDQLLTVAEVAGAMRVSNMTIYRLIKSGLRQSLSFLVQEFVPIPVEEAVLDFHILDEFEKEGRRMVRILLVAAQKAMVHQLVQAAESAKLQPVGVDLVPFAIVRSVGMIDGSGLQSSEGVE